MKLREGKSKNQKSRSPLLKTMGDAHDRKWKDKGASPVKGLKLRVLDNSPTPSKEPLENTQMSKIQKDVHLLKQKELKISKKLKHTRNENTQLIIIKKKTEENIEKQKKLIDNQIDKVIEFFLELIKEETVYLDIGKDIEITGEDFQYPPISPINRTKNNKSFEMPMHLTSSSAMLENENLSYKENHKGSDKEDKKSIKSKYSKSKYKKSCSPIKKNTNLKKGFIYEKKNNKSNRNSERSLDILNKSKSLKKNANKSAFKDNKQSIESSLKRNKSNNKNNNLIRSNEMNNHLKKLILKKTVYMPSTLRALARTAEHKY
jgi:hypothetical protein